MKKLLIIALILFSTNLGAEGLLSQGLNPTSPTVRVDISEIVLNEPKKPVIHLKTMDYVFIGLIVVVTGFFGSMAWNTRRPV